ncbi:MAG: hypothetical protein KatS3mg131_0936 [Candidatus Tectimicrobiota bacterium]|nr:MAG: hypothetical protein KatS3mg131_0936 [Candidatus Tectomicrobia bacterium]
MGVEAIEDGAVLRDGRGDPQAGDKLKFFFRANCACYVYVVAIDGSGFVEVAFPHADDAEANPVMPGHQYLIPKDDTVWYGLDEYRGIEHVYFIASSTRRPELEHVIATLARGKREMRGPGYRPVREPAIVLTRGIRRVHSAAPVSIPTATGAGQPVTATAFETSGAELVITRWFRHE